MEAIRTDPFINSMLAKVNEWKLISTLIPIETPTISHPRGSELLHESIEHVHPFRQILIFPEGDALFAIGEKIYRCTPPTIAYANPLESHYVAPADDWRATTMIRINLRLGRVFSRLWILRVGEPDVSDLEDIFLPPGLGNPLDVVWTDLLEKTGPNVSIRRAKLFHATALLLTELLDIQAVNQRRRGFSSDEMLTAVTDLLDYDLGQGVSLETLAGLTGYSPGHFARLFRDFTGKTVHQYVEQRRIEAAVKYVSQGFNAKSIASRLGFSSAPAFYHWWSKKVGGKPRDLVRTNKATIAENMDPRQKP